MDRSLPQPAGIKPVSYRFAGLSLKADGTLWRGETALALPAQELALLRALLTRAGQVVSAGELSRALGGESPSSSQDFAACLASLRERLQPADCIETVYRRGYRILAVAEPGERFGSGSRPLLAILPFSNGFDVPEYLGQAVAEQTTDLLRRAHSAQVALVAHDSVIVLARRGLPAREIGKMLDAELLLAGQLFATPGRHRLRAEMIRVEDGAPLWVEDLIVERHRIVELVGELVQRIALRLHAAGVHLQAEAAPTTKSETRPQQREAHDLYLRAHHEWRSMERHRMQDAMGRLLRAIELDPSLMPARVDLAQLAVPQCIYGYLSPRIAAATVRRAAEGIPELDEQAVALLPALGWVEFHFDRDPRSALRLMARAKALPCDPANMRARSWLLLSRRRFGEAIEMLRAAIAADPWSPWLHAGLTWALHLAGERERSLAQADKCIDQFADYDNSLFFAAIVLAYNGEARRAIELAQTITARSPHYDLAISAQAYALACAGCAEESRNLLERLQWLSRERFVLNTLNAATHVALGHADAALEELRLADETRCPWFFQMLADPRLKPLHNRPAFAALESVWAAMEADARGNERSEPPL